jgi:hypothetical protein
MFRPYGPSSGNKINDSENMSKNAWRYFKIFEISQTLASWPFTNIFIYFILEDFSAQSVAD